MGQRIGTAVIGENNNPAPRYHGKLSDIALHRRCQHYAWTVIIGENKISLNRAGGKHDAFCAGFPPPLKHMFLGGIALSYQKQVIFTIAPGGGVLQTGDVLVGIKLGTHSRDPLHRRFGINSGLARP